MGKNNKKRQLNSRATSNKSANGAKPHKTAQKGSKPKADANNNASKPSRSASSANADKAPKQPAKSHANKNQPSLAEIQERDREARERERKRRLIFLPILLLGLAGLVVGIVFIVRAFSLKPINVEAEFVMKSYYVEEGSETLIGSTNYSFSPDNNVVSVRTDPVSHVLELDTYVRLDYVISNKSGNEYYYVLNFANTELNNCLLSYAIDGENMGEVAEQKIVASSASDMKISVYISVDNPARSANYIGKLVLSISVV